MPTRLFIASGIFHPESGGPATYLYEILPALQTLGWQPQVLTYGDAPTDGYAYPVRRVQRAFLPVRLWQYRRAATRMLTDADLLYAHTIDLPLPATPVPRAIKIVGDRAWERAIERGWIPPTTDIDAFQTMNANPLLSLVRASRARQVRGYDQVIVPSEYLKRMVIGWGVPEARIQVIYNAMPPMIGEAFPTQQSARAALGWQERPTLLTAARLTAWKGVDHLIRALANVPDVRLVVAGDGPQLPALQRLAQALALTDRVTFLGRVPRAALYTMMQAADYFALYSGYEGLPHVLLEALRVGTPIIASDKGGNPEVVHHDDNGLLVPYINHEALVETLHTAFAPGKREALAANTTKHLDRFDFQQMVTKTDDVLRRLL